MELVLKEINHIPEVARDFLNAVKPYKQFAFYGSMGVGKTTFIREICHQLGVVEVVTSPMDSNGASEVDVDELVQSLIEHVPYKCVTLSGGEPMLQARELITLTEKLKDNGFTIVCYTGYQAEELPYIFRLSELLLQNVDVLVDGMFIKELLTPIDEPYKFVGSSNQRIINVQRSLDTGFIELWTDEDTRRVVNDEGYLRGLEQN
jgi:anaerobic ribonucleoside-triphosphate reductase activating protein